VPRGDDASGLVDADTLLLVEMAAASFASIVVRAARASEPERWQMLFDCAHARPAELARTCARAGCLESAANFLLIEEALEGPAGAVALACELLEAARGASARGDAAGGGSKSRGEPSSESSELCESLEHFVAMRTAPPHC
jgi:hypothetical protein